MQKIEITTGTNGYPEGLHRGVIGFNSFEDAQKFAEENSGEVILLHKKNGWELYQSKGTVYAPISYKQYLNDLGSDYEIADEERVLELLKEDIKNADDIRDIEFSYQNAKDLISEIENSSDDQVVISIGINHHETVSKEMMSYNEDNNEFIIGVEFKGYPQLEELD